jgi:hypothetical protein
MWLYRVYYLLLFFAFILGWLYAEVYGLTDWVAVTFLDGLLGVQNGESKTILTMGLIIFGMNMGPVIRKGK